MFKRILISVAIIGLLASSLNAYPRRVLFEMFTGQS